MNAQFETPNMDAMDMNDLRSLARVFDTLSQYATWKAEAIAYRKSGNTNQALKNEARCEQIYKSLPKEYRW